MTKMAAYEAGEGKKSMAIGTYFRGDYIAKEIIKSILYGTAAYGIMLTVYIAYHFEEFLIQLYDWDYLKSFGISVLKQYGILIVIYALITYIVYVIRYRGARRSLRTYYNNLRRLSSMYRAEAKEQEEE